MNQPPQRLREAVDLLAENAALRARELNQRLAVKAILPLPLLKASRIVVPRPAIRTRPCTAPPIMSGWPISVSSVARLGSMPKGIGSAAPASITFRCA